MQVDLSQFFHSSLSFIASAWKLTIMAKTPPKNQPAPPQNPLELKVNPRQQRFIDEYLVDLDATKAAVASG